jgi:hypothetical protein
MTINNDEDDVRKASKRWKRRDTENGSRQKQKTKYEVVSRRRAKEFDITVGRSLIEWGHYSPNFQTSGTEGESELHDFLQGLEKISEFAETGATTTRLLSSL